VLEINKGATVSLPVFDKSLHGGQGDRSSQTVDISAPIDVFILEGWSVGFEALGQEELVRRYSEAEAVKLDAHFTHHPLQHLLPLDEALAVFAPNVYPFFSVLIQIKPKSLSHILAWRLEQEHAMKAANGGHGMSDDEVRAFVERYLPGYELWGDISSEQWDSALVLEFGEHREVERVEKL
jgi:pantothenate kinase-related protein Tda10